MNFAQFFLRHGVYRARYRRTMSENMTSNAIADEGSEILNEFVEYYEPGPHQDITSQIENCYFLSLIVIGVPCNILALLILIRRRLWLHHKACIYLAEILVMNAAKLVVLFGDLSLELFEK